MMRRGQAARWAAVFGAVAGGVLLSSSAGAAKTRKPAPVKPADTYFGGGAINPRAQGHSTGNAWVLALPSRSGSMHLAAQLIETCRGPGNNGSGITPLVQTSALLRPGASFSGRLQFPTTGSAGKFNNTLTFSGRFTAARRAIATVRVHAAGVTNPADSCDTGPIKVQLIAPGPGAGSGAVARRASYFGTNASGPYAQGSQSAQCVGGDCLYSPQGFAQLPVRQWPMMLQTAADGRSVALLSYGYTTKRCMNTNTALSGNELGPPPAKIAKNGAFVEHDKFDEPVGNGYVAHVVATVHGRFTARAVVGTLEVDHAIASPSGAIVDNCTTGVVHWSAVRP